MASQKVDGANINKAMKWAQEQKKLIENDLYEEPDVKSANGEPVVTRVLTIMLAEEY